MKTNQYSLTEGNIAKGLFAFAFPMFISDLFQQLYMTCDALIVGNFLGSKELAAVGSSGSLVILFVSFFIGLSAGAGVVIARYCGAGNTELMNRSINTTFTIGLLSGLILTIIGVISIPYVLRLMGTPSDVYPESLKYFRILFGGSVSMVMFNVMSGILQSVGDSKTPMKYLIIASMINIGLDLLFIGTFSLGVEYAALATIIAQTLSALLVLRKLIKSNQTYRLDLKSLKPDSFLSKKILKQGIPSGIQIATISIANVIVQANINSFGAEAMAGCGAHNKIQGFVFLPINCFVLALATFISQNLGAGKNDRIKKGVRFSMAVSIIMAESIGILSYIIAPQLVSLFSSDPKVIEFGVDNIRYTCFFYCLLAWSHCSASILRGFQKPMTPMFIMLSVWCILRVTYIEITLKFVNDIRVVFTSYPVTWIISSILFTFFVAKELKNTTDK